MRNTEAGTGVKAVPSKAIASVAAYEGATRMYDTARSFWRTHFAYSVVVSERDVLYADVHNWLLSIMPHEKHRSLLVTSSGGARTYSDMLDDEPEKSEKKLTIRFNDSAPRKVVVDGHRVTVSLETPEESGSQYREPTPSRIQFTTNTHEGQQAVIRHLHRLNSERSTSRKAVLRMVNQWGSWTTRSDLPPRTLDSVTLPKAQKDRIVSDLGGFLDAEDQYNRLALPWHRGYMFHGPPGTGKTSLVKALANHFNLDLWYVSLADLKAESSLLGLLAEVGPRSILLLEDIDTMRITHDRDGSDQGTISMSSLLNTLDGVATPHGLVTAMTTNRFDVLDHALTRAGRMDLVEELDYPSGRTLANLYRHFFDVSPQWITETDEPVAGLSTAQVSEIFKRNMSAPRQAELEVLAAVGRAVEV